MMKEISKSNVFEVSINEKENKRWSSNKILY